MLHQRNLLAEGARQRHMELQGKQDASIGAKPLKTKKKLTKSLADPGFTLLETHLIATTTNAISLFSSDNRQPMA